MTKVIGSSGQIDVWGASGLVVEPALGKKDIGWQVGEQPPAEYMNFLFYELASKVNHILANGIPLWNSIDTFAEDAVVLWEGAIYRATEENQNSEPPSSSWVGFPISDQIGQFEPGTKMLFRQAAAPTGWTKDETASLNDTALRVVTGALSDRTDGIAFSTLMATGKATTTVATGISVSNTNLGLSIANTNLGLSIANANLGLSVNAHALDISQIPAHTHTANQTAGTAPFGNVGSGGGLAFDAGSAATGSAGGGAGHTHGLSGATGEHGHGLNGTTTNHSHVLNGTSGAHGHAVVDPQHGHTIALNVNFTDVIVCEKD